MTPRIETEQRAINDFRAPGCERIYTGADGEQHAGFCGEGQGVGLSGSLVEVEVEGEIRWAFFFEEGVVVLWFFCGWVGVLESGCHGVEAAMLIVVDGDFGGRDVCLGDGCRAREGDE